MSADLVEFLRARLDDAAREQQDPETAWHARGCASLPDIWGQETGACDCCVPAGVLADIEAKRRIVEEANLYLCDRGPGCGYRTKHGHSVLRYLALSYADHPDYQEEWRPS